MKTCEQLREFEQKVEKLWLDGELPYLFHLSGGNEERLISIFERIRPCDYVFCSHRAHYHYLLKGGSEDDLMKKIRNGKSMFLFNRKMNFLSSSVLAGVCGIACGVALSIKLNAESRWVYCFIGDGGADNGHFYEAVRYATSMDLPIRFIVEDNNKSCDSNLMQRGSFSWVIDSPKVYRYHYELTHPHCQTNDRRQVLFKVRMPKDGRSNRKATRP